MYIVKSADNKNHVFTKIELIKNFDGCLGSLNPDRMELSLNNFRELLDKFKSADNFHVIMINGSSYTLKLYIAGDCMITGRSIINLYTITEITNDINLSNMCQMCLIHGYKNDLFNVTARNYR